MLLGLVIRLAPQRLSSVPLVRFACAGLALLALHVSHRSAAPRRSPTALADSETLQRVAITLGLDREAGVVRRRLAELGQFLDLPGNDAMVEQEARDLGLAATDPIIRRHIEHLAELALRQGGASILPDESEVAHYYETEVDQFTLPARVGFQQIYFSFARHGAQTEAIARTTLERLRRQHLTPSDVADWGDPFVLSLNPRAATAADLQRAFGPELATAIETAPHGAWSEPLRSAYGLHLVWVRERIPPRRQPLDAVRNRIIHRLAHDHSDDLAARRLATLRQTAARQTP